jgi:GDP-4-dehydro-6-deoxy-D-mannose reductase
VSGPVLITGASGLVGSHLVEYLASAHEVVAWTRGSPPAEVRELGRWESFDLLDRARVRAAVAATRPARIFHCAGATSVAASWNDPAGVLAANVLAPHNLFDALRRAGVAARVLVPGSAAVYAASALPLTEVSPVAPDSPYALSKLAQEALGRRALREDGIEVILTRSFNHTGPRQSPDFVAPSLARQVALIEAGAAEPVIRVGDLEASRDLTDVRDVVRAYDALMDAGVPGEIYNVASGEVRTVRSILAVLLDLADLDVQVESEAARMRPMEKPVLLGDASKLRAATGWTPRISFEETLQDLLDYWRRAI